MQLESKGSRSILLIGDDDDAGWFLMRLFDREGWKVLRAREESSGFTLFDNERPELVVLDLELPGTGGLDLLQILRRADADAGIIVLTGHDGVRTAVEAMHCGAASLMEKPVDAGHLLAAAEQARETVRLRRQNRLLLTRQLGQPNLEQLGQSPNMRQVARQVELVSASETSVLLEGEPGTGKSWIARLIHVRSPRRTQPFVELNCAGLSASLLELELFGHEKGAFTDMRSPKRGLFEIAEGGTLFLNEIGTLTAELQPRLLQVLETQRFRQLDAARDRNSDVRLIAATSSPLAQDAQTSGFCSELRRRLPIFPIALPPLRERSAADIAALCRALLENLRRKLGRGPSAFSPRALALLTSYSWPGNIRQLRNVLERILILTNDADEIRLQDLPAEISGSAAPARSGGTTRLWSLAELERRHILDVLAHCKGNRVQAARLLSISRRTLYSKLQRYGASEPANLGPPAKG